MTSRLKRKLGDLGVDVSSRKANENFCLIGTPLPPLEKSKDTGEFVPLWKQEVRDEKGRRRLHGAFTGGFSAGYFNTVGSKEGWTPSTFVSSRNDRAKAKAAKPEDFMDEEDLQEMKERMLVSGENASAPGAGPSVPKTDMGFDDDPVAAALQTSGRGQDTPGARILKKMGWRPGQGVGPRVSLKERKRQDAQAFDPYTGVKSLGNTLDVASDDEEANKHTYPRRDTPILNISNQNKRYGLGFRPDISLNEQLGVNSEGKPGGPNISAGFGLGALNDADEDDIDIYESASGMKNRVAFDRLYHDDDTMTIGKPSASKVPTVVKTSTQAFYNGQLVLTGFILSDQPVQEDKWFPGPEVPANWKADPGRLWAATSKEKAQQHAPLDRNQTSATERGTILGETSAASTARSVFDFMSEKDRERIKRIAAGGIKAVTSQGDATPAPVPAPPVPHIDAEIAQAALRGFQPFTKEPEKQARYTAYLLSQANPDAPPLMAHPGQTPDAFHKEVEDFAKSAVLFKPMSGAMAGRFTSAATLDLGPKVHEGLHQPTQEDYVQKEEEAKREEEKNVPPKVHAANAGMYGPMTRETTAWMPDRLLCKRFGVKEPEPPADFVDSSAKPSFTTTPFEEEAPAGAASFESSAVASTSGPASAGSATYRLPRKLENIGLGDDETQGADILTYERPSMDIFKAIFASDDEDDGDDGEGPEEQNDAVDDDQTGNLKSLTKELKLHDTGPIDPATFKPTFVPREGKAKRKKEKRKKDKKTVLVSFQMDEDLGLGNPTRENDRPKKKRKDREKRKDEKNDVAMFVDSGSGAVKPLKVAEAKARDLSTEAPETATPQGVEGLQRTRKRAIDFLD
ncbi:DUF1604-domain-containing protein [Coprinellus micaceus]|uniref:DUF1604-domain-containing protein n=1 Tax=Coprinellus micaceus TaxID=71717 RepID=A0A4Y7TQT0_COPMI|nr:DUF1604-domain-containing protein [Coprinellus micaceus]